MFCLSFLLGLLTKFVPIRAIDLPWLGALFYVAKYGSKRFHLLSYLPKPALAFLSKFLSPRIAIAFRPSSPSLRLIPERLFIAPFSFRQFTDEHFYIYVYIVGFFSI